MTRAREIALPKVSINLCCYNGEKYLEETLQSIFLQTYEDWELVIVNDGSTDMTECIIARYKDRERPIIYHYQKNSGLANARNQALRLSRGEYIAFIDQDDIWLPQKLEKQMALLSVGEAGLVFSDAIYFNMNGKEKRLYHKREVPTGHIFRDLLADYYLCLSTVLVSRRALDGLSEWFDERLQISEEADVFYRIAYSWLCLYVPEPLVRYRIHVDSSSWVKRNQAPQEMEIIIAKYDALFPGFEMRFSRELKRMREVIQYEYAKSDLLNGNPSGARRRLAPILCRDVRFAALYLLALSPRNVLQYLLGISSVIPVPQK